MTKSGKTYSQFENELIVAAYNTANELQKDSVSLSEIQSFFESEFDRRWIVNALSYYWANGLSREQLHNGKIGEQRISLTRDGFRAAERLIDEDAVGLQRNDPRGTDHDRTPSSLTLSKVEKERLLREVSAAEVQIDRLKLGNTDRSNAIAYLTAIRALAEAPEPPKDLIWKLIGRASDISGIASLFVSLAGVFA
ncbi:hypothetical protein GRI38_13850 [Altererythrobacter aurantiacus]|uniref:Uncharacterized protein n=1 Tax=Parapontixanthobacter aurantiacus TaxID=1463599 RepID=A0A844ZIL5_9SPHN|nr:hypothetical protein [Parapontixanthobacter aurantiacus]MXO87112.1 hypothetical protein [Parapontixanthobacter aurantiacus]